MTTTMTKQAGIAANTYLSSDGFSILTSIPALSLTGNLYALALKWTRITAE